MVLLSPALLWLLATGPVLLFFYVWRARHKRLVAPSVLLWQQVLQETEHRPSWRLPIRHILLLLELLALALLGLALARPAVSVGVARQEIVALDASLAMTATDGGAAGTRFAAARALARGMIGRLGPAETMSLVRVGTLAEVVVTSGDHEALGRALDRMRPDDSVPAMGAAVLLARHLAALGHNAPAHLMIVTARALGGAPADPCAGAGLPCGVQRVGTSDDDQAVTALSATCPPAPGDCSVFARIVNRGPRDVREPVSLFADGQPLPLPGGGAVYVVGAHSRLDLLFSAPRQAHTVELALGRHDILAADDRRWALLPRARVRKVLVVSDDPTLLDRAVAVLPNVAVTDMTPNLYTDADRLSHDVTLFDSWLPDNAPLGNALIINPPAANMVLPYDHALRNPAVAAIEARGTLSHELLKGVDLSALLVGSAPAYALPSWATPLVSANAGPLIFAGMKAPPPGTAAAGWTDTPRLLVVAFPLQASNLPRLQAFPLLLANAVAWLDGGDAGPSAGGSPAWGSVVAVSGGPNQLPGEVVDPAGRTAALPRSPSDGAPLFVADGAPGDYIVRLRGAPAAAGAHVVVNAPVAGDAAGGGPALAGSALAAAAVLVARQELWWAIALAVLAVLSVEWWIYARRT